MWAFSFSTAKRFWVFTNAQATGLKVGTSEQGPRRITFRLTGGHVGERFVFSLLSGRPSNNCLVNVGWQVHLLY